MSRRRIISVIALVTVLLVFICWWRYVSMYPYGWSHCCDKQLSLSLEQYALDHDGVFPFGEATPEASLSLLYPQYAGANLLRGKTVAVRVVQEILDRGERLCPDSCGWHYVEGLKLDDRGDIAIFWDKAGLGHNGERSGGGAMVFFVNGSHIYVGGAEWDDFLQQQERFIAERGLQEKVRVPRPLFLFE